MSVVRTALTTVAIATALFAAKIVAALASSSIGLVSTAIDSGLDMLMSLVVLGGIVLAKRPADLEHPYGHGKFESVTGLIEAGVLAGVGVLIGFFGIQRIQDPQPITLDAWIVAVLVVSMLVGAERGLRLWQAGEEHRSPALSVDAWHYASDVVTTGIALLGAYLATHGYPWTDGAAALAIGGFLVAGSVHVGYRATADLVDRVPPTMTRRLEGAIEDVDHVRGIPQVRVRGAGSDLFVDATVEVPRALDIERAHEVMDEVEQAVRDEVGEADVTVHAEPVMGRESAATTLEVIASRVPAILGIHEIFVDELGQDVVVDCHLEVDATLSLQDAHGVAQDFEDRVKDQLPRVTGVRTHIEPMPQPRQGRDVTGEHDALVERIEDAAQHAPFERAGSVAVKEAGGNLETVVTVLMDGTTPLEEAHAAAEELERRVLGMAPQLDRVVVHVEPAPGT